MNTVNDFQESVGNETYVSLVGNLNVFFLESAAYC